jgi:hypothetical protein
MFIIFCANKNIHLININLKRYKNPKNSQIEIKWFYAGLIQLLGGIL